MAGVPDQDGHQIPYGDNHGENVQPPGEFVPIFDINQHVAGQHGFVNNALLNVPQNVRNYFDQELRAQNHRMLRFTLAANCMVTSYNFQDEFIPYLADQLHPNPHDLVLTDAHMAIMEGGFGNDNNDALQAARRFNVINHLMMITINVEHYKMCNETDIIQVIPEEGDRNLPFYTLHVDNVEGITKGMKVVVCRTVDFEGALQQKGDFPWYFATVMHKHDNTCLRIYHRDRTIQFHQYEAIMIFNAPSYKLFDCIQEVVVSLDHELIRERFFPPVVFDQAIQYQDMLGPIIEPDIRLNPLQRDIVNAALQHPPNFPLVVHGPPGTGKTETAKEIVKYVLKKNKYSNILICTPSNVAADVITKKIIRDGFFDHHIIFRAVSPGVPVTQIDAELEHVCIKHPDSGRFQIPTEASTLEMYKIIICTTGALPYLRPLGKQWFSHILIDEAGQMLDMETILPFTLFGNEDTRIVLCGDIHQLRPYLSDGILGQERFGANMSTLERLSRLEYFANDRRLCFTLLWNYRSHASIVRPFSGLCYNFNVVPAPGRNEALLTRDVGSPVLYGGAMFPTPMRFHVCYGVEQDREVAGTRNPSYVNLDECNVVLGYVDRCIRAGIPADDIAVISPYRAQTDLLEEQITYLYRGITVDSVERFQGDQRRVIIISTVRSTAVGFLKDYRRLNVAISRAESLLIVVGNAECLVHDPHWRWYIGFLNSMRCLYDPQFANPQEAGLFWDAALAPPMLNGNVQPHNPAAVGQPHHHVQP